jgi:CRISPR/Cas system-associated endonuclease/helicase Cas3
VDSAILVATQICELSLDISADMQLTDLAPIDALSQRGGRLHRNGTVPRPEKCGCKRCRERDDHGEGFVYRQI